MPTQQSNGFVKKGFAHQGMLKAVMPENYAAMFERTDETLSTRMITAVRPTLEAGAEWIRQGKFLPDECIRLAGSEKQKRGERG